MRHQHSPNIIIDQFPQNDKSYHISIHKFVNNLQLMFYWQLCLILYTIIAVMDASDEKINEDEYEIVIVQCCENCESHQAFSRHSEWKYYEQFNELKRKVERFVKNSIVIKNPVPDQLMKPSDNRVPNSYVNKQTNEPVTFPRVGAFEIYIYNVLIYSKLLTNSWPNHFKMIQVISKVIEEKKSGNSLESFSVYWAIDQEQPDKAGKPAGTSKRRKDYRVYKSKNKNMDPQPIRNYNMEHLSYHRPGQRTFLKDTEPLEYASRQLGGKAQKRIKLASLKNTINLQDQQEGDEHHNNSSLHFIGRKHMDNPRNASDTRNSSFQKIFHSIQQLEHNDISQLQRKKSITDQHKLNSMPMQTNQSIDAKTLKEQRLMKLHGMRYQKSNVDLVNKSIQYEEQEGMHCDFGIQINDGYDKEINHHYVQTDRYHYSAQPMKVAQTDQQVEVHMSIRVDQVDCQSQTVQQKKQQIQTNTEVRTNVNRGLQFPVQSVKSQSGHEFEVIDEGFEHMHEKRRNIADNNPQFYSIDRFQEKQTKYKWTGRAKLKQNVEELRRSLLLEILVFNVYNYYGIKTLQKRMSYQSCSNVIVSDQKIRPQTALIHILTSQNPQLQYLSQFEQYSLQQHKYPLSEELTFRSSKQKVKFSNYGALLAIAYFLDDWQIFTTDQINIGLVVSNEEVQEIFKLSADSYELNADNQNPMRSITVSKKPENKYILQSRLTQQLELQFIAMINKIAKEDIFEHLLRDIQDNFINMLPSHRTYRKTLLSMRCENVDEELVRQFIQMLIRKRERLIEEYQGDIYSFEQYGSLDPAIKFSMENYKKQAQTSKKRSQEKDNDASMIQRKLIYNEKIVASSDVQKHLRNKDHFVMITGESGIGKSTMMRRISQNLQQQFPEKIRIFKATKDILTDEIAMKNAVNSIFDDHRKQIIVIDEAEHFYAQVVSLLERLYSQQDSRSRPEMSFLVALIDSKGDAGKFKARFTSLHIEVIQCDLLPLDSEQIRAYLLKEIKYQTVTDKNNFVNVLINNQSVITTETQPKTHPIRVLRNPFYLNLYTQYLAHVSDLTHTKKTLVFSLNRYALFKQVQAITENRHKQQTKSMGIDYIDVIDDLRRIAFEYYHNNYQVNAIIEQLHSKNTSQAQLITNQLAFYPLNLQAMISKSKFLFKHHQFLIYYLEESYCFYLQKSYKNMKMEKIYAHSSLLALIREKYQVEGSYSKLIQVIDQSRKYKSMSEQASNAITLLNKIGYTFSNHNFDQVQIPNADLSFGLFYFCTFRDANMENTIIYKAQFIGCPLENCKMDNINLYERKYEIEYTVLTAAISIDGKNLAVGCGNYLIILSTDSGKEIRRIQAHMDIIRTVRYSKDNNSLITIADDKTLRMWDTRTYRSVVFRLPQKGTIAFSNETETIAVVRKNNVKIWNIKSMASEEELEGHSDLVTCIDFSSDGRYIVTGSRDMAVRIWDCAKAETIRIFKGHSSEILAAKISPNKKTVVSSAKNRDLIVWDIDSRSQITKSIFADEVVELCLDDKQKYVIIAFSKQTHIVVASLSALEPIHFLTGHKNRIISLRFDFYYRRLVSLCRDKTVRVWQFDKIMELEEKKYHQLRLQKLKKNTGPVLALAFCGRSNRYATAHENGEINYFSASDNRHIDQVFSHNGQVSNILFDKNGQLYSAGSDGIVRIWNIPARRDPKSMQIHSFSILQLKLNERYRLLATSSAANQLVVYDLTGGKSIMSTRQEGKVLSIEFNQDEKSMAVGGTQKYVSLYNITNSGNEVARAEQLGPNTDTITCMHYYEDKFLIVALKNGHVVIWNHLKVSVVKKIENLSSIRAVLSFHKQYICMTSQDGKIRVVDMEEGREVKIFKYPENPSAVALNGNQTRLYEATEQGNIVVWNLNSLNKKHIQCIFDKIAFDSQANRSVQIIDHKYLLVRDLQFHQQHTIELPELESDVEGVTYYHDSIILLLKNGIHWQVGKKQFEFKEDQESQGELAWVRDIKQSNFYRTPVKKIKGIKLPVYAVLESL